MAILPFAKISKYDAAIAGGKGASLGEMTYAGIPVPPGFVVLASTFEEFLRSCAIHEEIDAILHTVDVKTMHTVERASEEIQGIIMGAEMPAAISREIVSAFNGLGCKYVAVRSSATAEDSSTAAWAGQLDSFLNTTAVTLLENVKRCWASLFTPRAIFYRHEKNLHETHISVAVVVQQMVASEVSGIGFSVHPVSCDENQLIIEAGLGLGEAIVSGQITPDSYVVEKSDLKIVERSVASQRRGLFRVESGGGNEWREVEGGGQKLRDGQIVSLAKLIISIEKHYGFPVDVEWAYASGEFYIVQSRPITTLNKKSGEYKPTVMIILQSRERSLVYFYVWREANQLYSGKFFDTIKNILFINIGFGKTSAWYGEEELNTCVEECGRRAVQDKNYFTAVRKEFYLYFNLLLEYFKGKRKIRNVDDLKKYYFTYVHWWPPMAVLYVLPESSTASKDIQDVALKIRSSTEKYTDLNDTFFIEAVRRLLPQYADIASLMTPEEIFNSHLLTPDDVQKIRERGRGYVLYNDTLYSTDNLEKVLGSNNLYLKKENIFENGFLKGSVGCKGNVKGIVRVIFSKTQLADFKEGEILVTEMTSPDYIPYMKKAAGIITDEGGVNCHASIVARELKKPCIIGTRNATAVLKEGDFVEVDAEKGIVRIIDSRPITTLGEDQSQGVYGDSDIIANIKKLSWYKSWEAKFPLFTVTIGAPGYFKPMNEIFGFEVGHFLVMTHEGILSGYWVEKEMDAFGNYLSKLAQQDPQKLSQWSKELRAETDKFRNIMKRGKNFFLKKENFRKLRRIDEVLTAYQIAVREVINYLPDDLRKQYTPQLLGARKHSEMIFFELSDTVTALLKVVAKKENLTAELIGCLTGDELEDYFDKGLLPSTSTLKSRYECSGFIKQPEFTWLSKEDVHGIEKSFVENASHEINGQTAYKGRVTGIVRVVKNFSLAKDFKKGEILVTGMTDPHFVPLMKKALAIVTDGGGMLCHAAIVCRELKIPCLVGTKIATRVLKDGDVVEVDATRGVVKIIKRN